MHEVAGFSVGASFAAALVVVFIFHFVANVRFVFRSGAGSRAFLRYTGSALAFRALDFLLFKGIMELTSLYYVGVVLAVSVSNAVKFLVYKYLVFIGR